MQFLCLPVLPGSAEAQVNWCGIVKCLLIAYFISNISAKKYQNPFTCAKVIASQRWDIFLDTMYLMAFSRVNLRRPVPFSPLPAVPEENL